jgi:D-alanyl-lipoteichoic acid acyltransferase DltB (MBOAT superfamily)
LYKPLGGNKGSMLQTFRNTVIIFLVSGFWHGANWTFVCWGAANALLFIPLLLSGKNKRYFDVVAANRSWPSARELFSMIITFIWVTLAWVFFRAENVTAALQYLFDMFNPKKWGLPSNVNIMLLILIIIFILIEWWGRRRPHALEIAEYSPAFRRMMYTLVFGLIFFFGIYNKTEFIYFQF